MFLILCFMLFTAPKEPNQIPLLVINADNDAEQEQESHDVADPNPLIVIQDANDPIEVKEEEESLNLAEPIDDIIRIVDAVLDP